MSKQRPTPPRAIKIALLVVLCVGVAVSLNNSIRTLRVWAAALPSIIYDNNLFICTEIPCTATAPSTEGNLIVEGLLKITGGSPGAGKVLTSDANGVGSWQTPSVAASGWTDDGDTVRLTTSGDSVGIGTSNPAQKLDVIGDAKLGTTYVDANGNFEVNNNNTGNRSASVDLIGDNTNTDYGARFIREGDGPNANTQIQHRGTGALQLVSANSANVAFFTNALERLTAYNDGHVVVGANTTGTLFSVNGGDSIFRWARGNNQGTIQGQAEVNNNHTVAGGSEPVWISFNREGAYTANFALQTDNFMGLRDVGSTYLPLRSGLQSMGYNTAPQFRFLDTDHIDWFMYLQDDNNIVWAADSNNDGTPESWPMYMTNTVMNVSNLECSNCIDNSDLKTTTGVITAAVPATTQMADYMFFPNIEWDDCSPSVSSANILRPFQGNAADNFIGLYSTYVNCNSGTWDVRFRYIAASRDPEIFGWYDPENGVLRSLWINELDINRKDQLPMTFLEEHPEWIPVQATIFDRDLARLGQDDVDADEILKNYTFTRIAKANQLPQNDELVAKMQHEYQECMVRAKAQNDQGNLDDPEKKCPQFITHPDIYYGKLERSESATQAWDRITSEQLAAAEKNKVTSGADLAENYTGQSDVVPGEIVAIDRSQNNFLVRATAGTSQQLAGVVSTSPGLVLGHKQDGNVELALVGRVPVRMSQSSLPVQTGDMIAVSNDAGKGMKATQAGWVVGKALEAWTPGSEKETVLVLLNTAAYDPQLVEKNVDSYQLAQVDAGSFRLTNTYNQVIDRVLALKSFLAAEIRVGLLRASVLEVGGIDIGSRLQQLDQRIARLEQAQSTRVTGQVTFPAQARTILINDDRVTTDTAILLTPRTITTQHPAVTEVRPGSGFVISVPQGGQEMVLDYSFTY